MDSKESAGIIAGQAAIIGVRMLDIAIQKGVAAGVQAADERMEANRQRERKGRYDRRLHNTRLLLKSYRALKHHALGAVATGSQANGIRENAVDILDSLDDARIDDTLYIESIKRSRQRTQIILDHIDDMLRYWRIDCEQSGKVRLFFAGVSIHCEDGPALYIKKCSPRLTIELQADTVNNLSDGAVYVNQDKADAVIYSKSDLTITGEGTLNISGAYRDGIVSKDDLRIKGGKINVKTVHNGICGKDCVEIFEGEIFVTAGNDGIKTTGEDADMGYISMEGGTITILCGDDPLSFVHGLFQTGGTINANIDPSLKESK